MREDTARDALIDALNNYFPAEVTEEILADEDAFDGVIRKVRARLDDPAQVDDVVAAVAEDTDDTALAWIADGGAHSPAAWFHAQLNHQL